MSEKSFNTWAKEIHQNAVDHGWWEDERSVLEIIALCHSELSEALEEHRDGRLALYYPCGVGGMCCDDPHGDTACGSKHDGCRSLKPEGIAVEFADCIIRILDYAGHKGWDMDEIIRAKHEYNKARAYRHGGKRA